MEKLENLLSSIKWSIEDRFENLLFKTKYVISPKISTFSPSKTILNLIMYIINKYGAFNIVKFISFGLLAYFGFTRLNFLVDCTRNLFSFCIGMRSEIIDIQSSIISLSQMIDTINDNLNAIHRVHLNLFGLHENHQVYQTNLLHNILNVYQNNYRNYFDILGTLSENNNNIMEIQDIDNNNLVVSEDRVESSKTSLVPREIITTRIGLSPGLNIMRTNLPHPLINYMSSLMISRNLNSLISTQIDPFQFGRLASEIINDANQIIIQNNARLDNHQGLIVNIAQHLSSNQLVRDNIENAQNLININGSYHNINVRNPDSEQIDDTLNFLTRAGFKAGIAAGSISTVVAYLFTIGLIKVTIPGLN